MYFRHRQSDKRRRRRSRHTFADCRQGRAQWYAKPVRHFPASNADDADDRTDHAPATRFRLRRGFRKARPALPRNKAHSVPRVRPSAICQIFFNETPVSDGKSNGRLLRIGPAFPEVVAGSQHRPPITLRRSPYAMLALAGVISHRVNIVSVEIRTTHLPALALRIRAKNEGSFRRSHQQKKVSLPDMRVSHAVQDGGLGWVRIGARAADTMAAD